MRNHHRNRLARFHADFTVAMPDKAAMTNAVADWFSSAVAAECQDLEEAAVQEWEKAEPDFTAVKRESLNGLKYLLWVKATMLALVEEIAAGKAETA
jgi:hypothetical protein